MSNTTMPSFMDTDTVLDFRDPNTIHDRVLVIEGQKFYVSATNLSLYSEFFLGLFNSQFVEQNMKEIEIKEVSAVDFNNFLHALQPSPFAITGNNLAGLMQLSCRFLCPVVWRKCMIYLGDRNTFHQFQMKDLLEWSSGSDSVEFKHLSMFSEYFSGLFNSNFQEKDQKEIELKDIKSDEFETFLNMLYPFEVKVTNLNLAGLIRLSNMFLTPFIFQKCIKFLENPINVRHFELDELLEWMTMSTSERFKINVENHCIQLVNEADMSTYLKIAIDYKFEGLKVYIVDKLCAADKVLDAVIVNFILHENFADFEEYAVTNPISSSEYAKLRVMYTSVILIEYDLFKFEEWFTENFLHLLTILLSVHNVGLLMNKLDRISAEHKVKLENLLLKSAEKMQGKQLNWNEQDVLRTFLPEFAFLLYKNDPKNVIAEAFNFLNNFPCRFKTSQVKTRFDNKLSWMFHKTERFSCIEMVLQNNLNQTKGDMEKYLKTSNKKDLMKNVELVGLAKYSPIVDSFIRESLMPRLDRKAIIKHLFG